MKLYGRRFDVTIPGESYVWDPDQTTLSEELMLEREMGSAWTSFEAWVDGIDERLAEPCQLLIWFLRRQAGRQEERFSIDFPIRQLKLFPLDEDEVNLPESQAGSETSEPATESDSSTSSGSDPGSGTA